ncbi:hypothetical protein [Phytohabitans rumicis]|uniref:Uncharacterized protein n=1 Tax=Phytohabitans rumicis TaxID=1076125 RepID=A0A6V8LHW3_9ACTN|nr:hypothetical protein [Phytohabitans rumicis]GFJ92245.1 hypothetical protein Prum_058870 [Phytohabitans rumicis]
MVDVTAEEADHDEERAQLIEAIQDNLNGVYGQIADLGSEVDDYLAEYRYDEVKQSIESLSELIASNSVDEVSELADLCADAGDAGRAAEAHPVTDKLQIPRLLAGDLPPVAEPTGDEDYDEVVDSLRNREGRCNDHIRKLFGCAERLWEGATDAARLGQARQANDAVRLLRQLPAELSTAYSLWERCLVDLYNENPAHLGEMGDMVRGFEVWLTGRQKDGSGVTD